MKKSIAMKWIKALRSGDYEQGTEFLKRTYDHSDDSEAPLDKPQYCCLGVLCELNGIDINADSDELSDDLVGILSADDPKLPKKYKVRGKEAYDTLSALNDHGASFKQIANIIEKNWEKL